MMSPEEKAQKLKVLELFREGRRLYTMQKFAEAREAFAQALKVDHEDGPSRVYWTRCKHYLENPPDPGWDGVFTMKDK
jgi:hypothetical protein